MRAGITQGLRVGVAGGEKDVALALVEVHLKSVVIRCGIAPVLGDVGIALIRNQRGVGGALGSGQSRIRGVEVERNLVDVGLAQQMPAQVADIGNLGVGTGLAGP